ncbi:hypothetical protein [Deinococcus pimensis]|nr:hypothetical protein [Deinococcus pimensis]
MSEQIDRTRRKRRKQRRKRFELVQFFVQTANLIVLTIRLIVDLLL